MKPFKCFVTQNTTVRKEYKLYANCSKEIYWDEGVVYYKSKGRWKYKQRELMNYQVRMYRTWKHNRKTKYLTKTKMQ